MERKIIRRIPLPEMDLNEEDMDGLLAQNESDINPISLMSAVAAQTGTKTLNYTADTINNKLSHVNSFAVATLTQDAYAPLFLFGPESTINDAMVEGTYMLYTVPDNSSSALDFGSPIVNFKIYMNFGNPICEITCVSGQIKDIGLEIYRLKDNWARWCVFIKSNSFRGVAYFKELNLASRNASLIWLYVNSQETTSISNSWDFYSKLKYNNVASELSGDGVARKEFNNLSVTVDKGNRLYKAGIIVDAISPLLPKRVSKGHTVLINVFGQQTGRPRYPTAIYLGIIRVRSSINWATKEGMSFRWAESSKGTVVPEQGIDWVYTSDYISYSEGPIGTVIRTNDSVKIYFYDAAKNMIKYSDDKDYFISMYGGVVNLSNSNTAKAKYIKFKYSYEYNKDGQNSPLRLLNFDIFKVYNSSLDINGHVIGFGDIVAYRGGENWEKIANVSQFNQVFDRSGKLLANYDGIEVVVQKRKKELLTGCRLSIFSAVMYDDNPIHIIVKDSLNCNVTDRYHVFIRKRMSYRSGLTKKTAGSKPLGRWSYRVNRFVYRGRVDEEINKRLGDQGVLNENFYGLIQTCGLHSSEKTYKLLDGKIIGQRSFQKSAYADFFVSQVSMKNNRLVPIGERLYFRIRSEGADSIPRITSR